MVAVNPEGHVTWDEYTEDPGDDFLRYNLYRVDYDSGEDVRIAVIDEITTTDYLDYRMPVGPVTYRLSVTVDRSGAIIESDRISVTEELPAWRGLWLHDVNDPTEAVQLLATAVEIPRRQGQERRLVAGRRLENTYVGALYSRSLALQLIPERIPDAATIAALDRFLDRHYTHGRALCVRMGARPGARWFVTVDGSPGESMAGALSRGQVTLVQDAYEEAV